MAEFHSESAAGLRLETLTALADLDDDDLERLVAATYAVPQTAPGLLAWIDGACEWDLNRRRGFDYPLQPPEAAVDPCEDAVSIDAAMAIVS